MIFDLIKNKFYIVNGKYVVSQEFKVIKCCKINDY